MMLLSFAAAAARVCSHHSVQRLVHRVHCRLKT